MLRCAIAAAVLATVLSGLTGCAADKVSQVGERPRELISFAATAEYPGNARESDSVQVVAFDDPRRKEFELHNLGTVSVPASAVWVNGGFVTKVESIPPKEHVTVRYSSLVEAGQGTNDFKRMGQPLRRVELATDGGLFTVLGPATR